MKDVGEASWNSNVVEMIVSDESNRTRMSLPFGISASISYRCLVVKIYELDHIATRPSLAHVYQPSWDLHASDSGRRDGIDFGRFLGDGIPEAPSGLECK